MHSQAAAADGASSNMASKTKDLDNELVQMFRPFACVCRAVIENYLKLI